MKIVKDKIIYLAKGASGLLFFKVTITKNGWVDSKQKHDAVSSISQTICRSNIKDDEGLSEANANNGTSIRLAERFLLESKQPKPL